jgi:preprotein translocase subunit YajC
MHLIHIASYLAATASAASKTTTTTKSTGSGSSAFLLVIVVLFALLYFLLIRPNQRRRMQAMRQSRAYDVGDEVVAGGMVGRVERVGDGQVDVEVANGVVVSFVPQAVQLLSAYQAAQARRGGGLFGAPAPGSAPSRTGYGTSSPGGTSGAAQRGSGAAPDGAAEVWPEAEGSDEEQAGEDQAGDGGLARWSSSGGTGAPGGGASN